MIFAFEVEGQHIITLTDGETQKPIEGAFVKIYESNDDIWDYVISEKDGSITIPESVESVVIWASHINYSPIHDTLTFNSSAVLYMDPSIKKLDQIVITGQYEPQSAENSVYHITSISKAEIFARGARNLEDVMTTLLNVRLQNDPSTGTSSLNLQGISGENIKVLIDGVPLAGRVDGQIDINQIDINQVEKIEIVEGPMAVNYGSNAMGGVVNIITNKNSPDKWFVNMGLNEETVGNEYGVDKGVHNQHITGGYNFSKAVFGQASLSHNYFGGYFGAGTGRSTQWDPKDQIMASILARIDPGGWSAFYKLDILSETIENKGEPSGLVNPIALDEEYKTNRFIHQVQVNYKLSNLSRLNALLSYTDYDRIKTQYAKNLTTGERPLSSVQGAQDTTELDAYNFRGAVTKMMGSSKVSYELGWDINLESGKGGRIEGTGTKTINDYGLYGSTEITAGNWMFRPALRISYNSVFTTPIIPSLHVKWGKSALRFRASYGRGFRAPSLKELYLEFIDASHRIFGNEDLQPENGHHLDAALSLTPNRKASNTYTFGLEVFYNALNNKIDFGQSPVDPTATTYINIDQFQSLGLNLTTKLSSRKITGEAGLGSIGRRNNFNSEVNDFLFSPEVVFNFSYNINSKLGAGIYYKYTGRQPRYILGGANTDPVVSESDAYHWLDVTSNVRFSRSLKATFGVKNLLNVKDISSGGGGGTHTGMSIPVSYGRSAFLRLDLNINGN